MPESSDWILKIISGPHQGAEVVLRPGRTVVGAHAECDLVLHDMLVAPQHFALVLDGKGLTVEALEGRVFCGGKRVTTVMPVPPFAFVTAGTTHVVVGPAGTRWPLLSLADVPELEKEVVAPASPEPAAAAAKTAEGASAAPSGKNAPKPPTPEQRRRALWLAGVGGVLLVVWLALWFSWTHRPLAGAETSLRERAERVLNRFPEGKLVLIEEKGGSVVATGYFDTDSAQREISTALREEAPEITQRLWSTPRLLETAQGFVRQSGLPIELNPAGAGEIVARGEVTSLETWAKTRQLLQQEVPGLLRLTDVVRLSSPSAPVVSTAPRPSSTLQTEAPTSAAPEDPLESVSVVAMQPLGEGQGWLRLSNGQVLFRGAQLHTAGRVVEIQPDRAIVENGEARYALLPGVTIAEARKGATFSAVASP